MGGKPNGQMKDYVNAEVLQGLCRSYLSRLEFTVIAP